MPSTLLDRFNKKLSYKLHIPIILVVSIGLLIVTINAFISLEQLTENKYNEVSETFQNYAQKSLDTQNKVALTNVIAIANNTLIQEALATQNRAAAIATVNDLLKQYQVHAGFNQVKIHLHNPDMSSFLRSWKPQQYDDDLSGFRHSLHHVHDTLKPFVTAELGRAGILLRGIAPVFHNNAMVGTVEFIQSFDPMIQELKLQYELDAMVLGDHNETIRYFNSLTKVGNRVLVSGDPLQNQALIETLNQFDFGTFDNVKHASKGDFFVTAIPLRDFNNRKIGCFVIADNLNHISQIIHEAQQALIFQVMTMLIVNILIILTLVWLLHKSITRPISQLSEHIESMNHVIENLDALKDEANRIQDTKRSDEIGTISKTFNSFVGHISSLFSELQKSNKINDEYLKAVYAGSIVSKSDLHGRITYVNESLCQATGYTPEELIGQPHNIFRHPNTPKATFREMWRTITAGRIWHGLFKNKRKDGTTFYANITIVPILDDEGHTIEYLALRDDVTELVQSQKQLRKAFNTDPLTSLGNRFKLLDDYVALDKAYLAIIDIRSFKEINDFYGYDIGDQVIVHLSDRLFHFFDHHACEIYRLQGDEFAILANGELTSSEEFIDLISGLGQDLHACHLIIGDYQPNIDLTIGISTNRNELFTEADIAHKTAKKHNKTLVIYSDELKTSEEYKNNLLWTGEVKKALAEDRIVSFFQPIINNRSGEVEKYESLVRLIAVNGQVISPFFFLEIAKRARLYKKLTHRIIENTLRQASLSTQEFSINLTAEDIADEEMETFFINLIDDYQLDNRIVVEIVESESIQNFDQVRQFIENIKKRGCKIAIDDFGTGYSNFEFLLKLKPDYIKIDGSMIKSINEDSDAYNVVDTIVTFAKKNQIKTIAEFVCDEAVYQTVKNMGIDYSQGYLLGEPVPPEKLNR